MTVLEFYEHVLTELNKVEAPSLLLEDFNYFANKAVQQYINKVYNRYDINQQSTDDLRFLKTSAYSTVIEANSSYQLPSEDKYWVCEMPSNYLHLLSCIVSFTPINSIEKCGETKKVRSMARRLTSDIYPAILQNAYLKPSYKNPYYFLTERDIVVSKGTDASLLNSILNPCSENPTELMENKLEILCGSTNRYKPEGAYIDYIKTPSVINLTYEDLESDSDVSQILEFPEYVCYEIINEFVKLALENASDPRLETNIPINQTIAGVNSNN